MTSPALPTASRPTLLALGVLAGPLYVVVAAAQAVTRDGFDPRRHAVSLLANGPFGWVQVANLVVAGLLVVAAAVGLGRLLRSGFGHVWVPRLVGIYGVGLVASGAFVADPADGFPPGTPAGPPDAVTVSGVLHLAAGGIAFLALVGACLLAARRFAAAGAGSWAGYSATTGVVFLVAWLALVSTGGTSAAVNVAFAMAVVAGWAWLSAVAAHHLRRGADPAAG